MRIPVSRILMEKSEEFDLLVLAGEKGLGNLVETPELHRPGLAFAGFLDIFTYDRIQVLGNTEVRYLASLSPEELRRRIDAVCQFPIPCFIMTANNRANDYLVEVANTRSIPLLATSHSSSRFNSMLGVWLERQFAPTMHLHAVLVDVFGVGVLITGSSGIGKSECGLELIERGHRLVADDVVVIKRLGRDLLLGSANHAIQHHMEVRGLGIIDVEMLFGIGSVREDKRISLVIDLFRWTEDAEIDRLGLDSQSTSFLDVPVRKFRIPVDSGRNISILIETAALQHRILERGINPADTLNKRIMSQMVARPRGGMEDTAGFGR